MHRLLRYSTALAAALAIYEIVFSGLGVVVRQTAQRQQFYTMDRPCPSSWVAATPVGF